MPQPPHKPHWEFIGAKSWGEGNLTLHLKELRPQEDEQTSISSFPLSAFMPVGPNIGTVTEVSGNAG